MKQPAAFFLIGLLAACSVQGPEPKVSGQPAPEQQGSVKQAGKQQTRQQQAPEQAAESRLALQQATAASTPVCRLGPDNGPLLAERGIGGTGAPAADAVAGITTAQTSSVAFSRLADRGIGGTGIGGTGIGGTGIGGTGIVGVITGFASVCVNGLEVVYDSTASVNLNGNIGTVSALRGGQVVVIQADGPPDGLHARTISLRQEVAGRIEAVELGTGLLTIAGQPVAIPRDTWGAERFGLGDWVAVSGLQRPDGVVVASRLDPAPPGVFTARGRVARDGSVAMIGRLALTEAMANDVQDGQFVTVSGLYLEGRKQVIAVETDKLLANPSGYFGPAIDNLVVQAFIRPISGGLWLNGMKLAAPASLTGKTGADDIAVVSLRRGPDGSFSATGLTGTDFRVHAPTDPTHFRTSGVGGVLTQAPTQHAALNMPSRTDATGAGALSGFQPAATSIYVAPMPSVPFVAPSSSPPALALSPSMLAVPLTTTVPTITTPANIGQINPTPVTTTFAVPSSGGGLPAPAPALAPLGGGTDLASNQGSAPPPVQATPPPAVAAAPVLPPVAPAGSAPSGDSGTSRLMSLNHPGSILPSQSVHARFTANVNTRPSLSLTTTVGPGTVTPGSAGLPSGPTHPVATSFRRSPNPSPNRAGRH